ncbi:LPS translocon maturation chaperone LptM [Erwinia tasmaniensis]|nr:lipoprotein [Erwinia tasmaniensis]
MKKRICQLALVITAASLTGCGLKGPLYFPNHEQDRPKTTHTAPSTQSGSNAQPSATVKEQSAQPTQ